jgi:hypothetical protein
LTQNSIVNALSPTLVGYLTRFSAVPYGITPADTECFIISFTTPLVALVNFVTQNIPRIFTTVILFIFGVWLLKALSELQVLNFMFTESSPSSSSSKKNKTQKTRRKDDDEEIQIPSAPPLPVKSAANPFPSSSSSGIRNRKSKK